MGGERRAPARPGLGRDRGRSPDRKTRRSRSRSPIRSKLMAMAMHSSGEIGGKRGTDSRKTKRSSSREKHAGRLRMDELKDSRYKPPRKSPEPRRQEEKDKEKGQGRRSLDTAVKRAREERTNYWDKKILEAEEKDPHRWGHSGFKELYHVKHDRNRNSPRKRKSTSPSPRKRKRSRSGSPRSGRKTSVSRGRSLSSDSTSRSPVKTSRKSRNRNLRSASKSASPSPKRKGKPPSDRKAPERRVAPKPSSDKPKPKPNNAGNPNKTPTKNGTRKPGRKSRSVSSSDSSSSRSRSRVASGKNLHSLGQKKKETKNHTATNIRSNSSSCSSSDEDVLQLHAKGRGRQSSFSHSESESSSSSDRDKKAKRSDISSSSESDSSSDASDSDVSVRAKPAKKGKDTSLSPTERVLEEAVKAAAKKVAEAKKKNSKNLKVDKTPNKKLTETVGSKLDGKDCNAPASKKESKPPSESGETESESDTSDSDAEPRMTLSERFAKLSQMSTDKREMSKPVLSANEIDTKMRVVKDFRNPEAPKIYVDGNTGPSSSEKSNNNTSQKALPTAFPDDRQIPQRRDFHDRHRHMESIYQDNPAERPMDWANPRVRYSYYKDRGCFDERPISFDEYLKWEEWYHKYKEWLEQEGYYQDQEERRRGADSWNRMQAGGPRPLFSVGRAEFPERIGGPPPPGNVQPLSSRANFGPPEGNAYLQAMHHRVGGRITRTPGGSLTVNARPFQSNGSFHIKRRLGRP